MGEDEGLVFCDQEIDGIWIMKRCPGSGQSKDGEDHRMMPKAGMVYRGRGYAKIQWIGSQSRLLDAMRRVSGTPRLMST